MLKIARSVSIAKLSLLLSIWASAVSSNYISCADVCAEPFTELASTGLSQSLICSASSVFNTFVTKCQFCLNNATVFNTSISSQAGLSVALDLCSEATDSTQTSDNSTCPGVRCPLLLADVKTMGLKNITMCSILTGNDLETCTQSGCVTQEELKPYVQFCNGRSDSSPASNNAFSKPAVIAAVVLGTVLLCLAVGGYILYLVCLRGRASKNQRGSHMSYGTRSMRSFTGKRKTRLTRYDSKRVRSISRPPSLYVNIEKRGRWEEYNEVECDEKGYLPGQETAMVGELEGSSSHHGTGIHVVELDGSSPPYHSTAFPGRQYDVEQGRVPLVPYKAALRPTSSISKHSRQSMDLRTPFMPSVGSPLQVPHIPTPPQSQHSHFTPRFVSAARTRSNSPPLLPQMSTPSTSFAESIVPDIYQDVIRPSRSYITVNTNQLPPSTPVRVITSPSEAAPLPSRHSASIVSSSPPQYYELPPHARPLSDSMISPISPPTPTFSRHSSIAKKLMGRR